jgi:hypothetical protein
VWAWFPLTPLGIAAVVALAWFLKAVGVPHQDRIVLALGICGLAVIALAVVLVYATAICVKLRKGDDPQPICVEAGSRSRTGYRIRFARWNFLATISVTWERPRGVQVALVGDRGGLYEEISPRQRARSYEVNRRLVVSDVFHLTRIVVSRKVEQLVTIRPECRRVERLPRTPQLVRDDQDGHPEGDPRGDYIEMRPYVAGDPLRLVLWPIYARTGRLVVRAPEKAVSPTEKTLAYLVAAAGDEPAAGIARAALEHQLLGPDYLFSADGETACTRAAPEAVDQVVRSVNARTEGGTRLESLLAQGEMQGITACLMFLPPRPGAWLDRVVACTAVKPGPFLAIVGVDGFDSRHVKRSLRRFFVHDARPPAQDFRALQTVIDRLENARVEVWVIDRLSGQMFAAASLSKQHGNGSGISKKVSTRTWKLQHSSR